MQISRAVELQAVEACTFLTWRLYLNIVHLIPSQLYPCTPVPYYTCLVHLHIQLVWFWETRLVLHIVFTVFQNAHDLLIAQVHY